MQISPMRISKSCQVCTELSRAYRLNMWTININTDYIFVCVGFHSIHLNTLQVISGQFLLVADMSGYDNNIKFCITAGTCISITQHTQWYDNTPTRSHNFITREFRLYNGLWYADRSITRQHIKSPLYSLNSRAKFSGNWPTRLVLSFEHCTSQQSFKYIVPMFNSLVWLKWRIKPENIYFTIEGN